VFPVIRFLLPAATAGGHNDEEDDDKETDASDAQSNHLYEHQQTDKRKTILM